MTRIRHAAFLRLAAAAAVLVALGAPAQAQWPEKPVTLIVPFPAGGGTDAFARPLAAKLGEQLGKAFIIDNRGGAGGTVGAAAAAIAPKDGYIFLVGAVHHTIAPSIYPSLTYDLEKDFEPVAVIAMVPQVVVVNPSRVAQRTLADLIAFAKANPGKLNYASAGNGTSHHLAGELFKIITDTKIEHIPYRGAGPAMQDLVAGQVDMMFDGMGSSAGHIKAGRIVPLAVAAPGRVDVIADVPTAAQVGVNGYEVSTWYAVFAPAGTPKEITARLQAELVKALESDALKGTWAQQAAKVGPVGPAAMAPFVRSEIGRWAKVVKDANIKLD